MAQTRERPQTAAGAASQQVRALEVRREQGKTVRSLLEGYQGKFDAVLPTRIRPEKLIEVVMTSVYLEPKLLECTQSSLMGSVIQAAQLGLMPGLNGECWLLPYRNNKTKTMECQLMPGYKGLVKLAYNSGEIAGLQCSVVRDDDVWHYEYGTNAQLRHIPNDDQAESEMTHAYACVKLKGSDVWMFDVLNRKKIEKARASSRAAQSSFSPWTTHEDEMWQKTVLRHICKRLPTSIEKLARAASLDEEATEGIAQNLRALAPDLPDMPPGGAEEPEGDPPE